MCISADVVLQIPILRRILSWWGCVPANRKSFTKMLQMSHPYNVTTVIPGGIAEMFYGNGEDEQIVAVQRKVCVLNIYVIRRSKKCRRNFEIRSIKYLEDL